MSAAASALVVGLAGILAVWGCSGPQPLSVAIRRVDDDQYQRTIAQSDPPPKRAYYAWKAASTGKTVAQVAAEDAALSRTRNPFDAHRDPGAVSRGAVIFKYNCARCHGEAADGRGPAIQYPQRRMDAHAFGVRLAATIHRGAPRAWFRKISDGYTSTLANPDGTHNAMPPFAEVLAREQIWLAITYYQSLDMHAEPGRASAQ